MQLWPPVVDPSTLTRQVWDVDTARTLPGVGRALQLYGGMISQCPLDLYRGDVVVTPRPPFLQTPDVSLKARSIFVRVHVEDYLLHGNAVHLVTMRDGAGAVVGVKWFPAWMWHVADPRSTADGGVDYYLNGIKVNREDVVHVQRGAAPGQPWRGVGVVEEHLKTLNRAALEEAAESANLTGGGVPSVVVIAPNPNLGGDEAKQAAAEWKEQFAGPGRVPAVLPNGTQVIPLGWKPQEGEMVEARKLSLVDIANAFNLDPYHLGGGSSSHEYKSPGPMFLALLRTSLNPVMVDLEQVWSLLWMPPAGRAVKFDRLELTRDDFSTEVSTGAAAVSAQLMTREEWRVRWGMPVEPQHGELDPADDAGDDTSTSRQLSLVEMIQKVYLGVDVVVTVEEARQILRDAGAPLAAGVPDGLVKDDPAPVPPELDPDQPTPPDPDQPDDDQPDDDPEES